MRLIVLSLTVGALVGSASATTLFVDGLISGKHSTVKVKYGATNLHLNAGAFQGRLDDSEAFDMYCVDLDHVVSPPSNYAVDVLNVSALSNGHLVGKLYSMFAGDVDSNKKGAGLQMAIWDAVVDGGDGFGAGSFVDNGTDATILGHANTFLTSMMVAPSQPFSVYYFKSLEHPNGMNQNMVGPVPEPGSMAALIVGAAGVLRRRRARKA